MQSGNFGKEKNNLLLPGIETWMVQLVAKSIDQYFPTSVPQNIFRGSTRTCGINTYKF
jgi:hypothetical protein